MAEIDDWDVVAANNNSAAPNGFPEGMNYSDVNNAARENMAVIARHFKDNSGEMISTGAGNSYELATNRSYTAFANGMKFKFRADKTNTGAVTITLPVVGSASLTRQDGEALAGNDIQTGGVYEVVYSSTRSGFVLANADLSATESRKGVIEIATEAEHLAGTSTTRAATPAGVTAIFDALTSDSSFTRNGYATLQGGLIIQWGRSDDIGDTPNNGVYGGNEALATTFPNALLMATCFPVSINNASANNIWVYWNESQSSTSRIDYRYRELDGVQNNWAVGWIAIGH